MTTLIEKVARVLCIENGESNPDRMLQLDTPTVAWSVYTDEARAAIAAVAEWLDEHQQLDKDGSVHCALSKALEAKP